jgi:hypothetical protein
VWAADVAADGVTGLQVELADLAGRDVDVVWAGQVVVVRRAEEAVAVGQNLEDAFGEDVAFFFALVPAMSRPRASLPSSAMLFSLSSEMVSCSVGVVVSIGSSNFSVFIGGLGYCRGGYCRFRCL